VSSKIGFIGLGIMGRPMVKNLLKAGHKVTVYDIVPAGMEDAVAAGAEKGSSPKDVAARTDVIITMVPDGPEVEQAVFGPDGVLEGAKKGSTVIDMSSISPMVSQKVGAALEAKGIDGTLAIMVGGSKEVFDKMEPILKTMGSTVTLTGKIGAGNVTKLANQIMVAVNIAAMSEALALATKAGLDPEVVFNAVKAGLAGSTVLNVKAPMVYSRNFKPGFRIRLHQKDLRNALLAAESLKVSLPLTSTVQNMLIDLMNNGKGDLDHSAIVQVIEQASAVEVKKPS
jgi:2-hydroxy-3-oxopropionate reductase